MSEAVKDRVALLCFQGAGPGFALVHFAFELVKKFPDVPPVFVEEDDLIGGQGVVAGEVGVDHAVLGVCVNNIPQGHAVAGGHEVV